MTKLLSLLMAFMIFNAQISWAAISVESTDSGTCTSCNSLTLSNFNTSAGNILIVDGSIRDNDGQDITDITFNSVSMVDHAESKDGGLRVDINRRYTVSPSGTHDITITVSGSFANIILAAILLSGIDTVTPTGTTVTGGVESNNISDNVTVAVGDLAIEGCVTFLDTTGTLAGDGGQSEIQSPIQQSSVVSFVSSSKTGDGSISLGCSFTSLSNDYIRHIVTPFKIGVVAAAGVGRRRFLMRR